MKKVIFEKIRIRNFLSYGAEPIELVFQEGINFITGFNKDDNSYNGVGKTSLIVESLSFVLFGKTYRNINQKEIRNDGAKDTCAVECWYSVNGVNYEIVRTLSPDVLTRTVILEDGTRVDKTKTKPETTKDIIEDLGISKEVFTNTIVMTSKESSSFLSQDKSLKTKFIEGILGLEVFSKLAKMAKDEYTAKYTETGKEEARVQELEKSLERDQTYATAHETRRTELLKEYDDLLMQLRIVQPVDLSAELEQIDRDIKNKEVSLVAIEEKYQKAIIKRTEIESDIRNNTKVLNSFINKPTICPTCKRAFDDSINHTAEEERKTVETTINENQLKLTRLISAIQTLGSNVTITKNQIKCLRDKRISTENEHSLYQKSQEKIVNTAKERANVRTAPNPFTDKIEKDRAYLKEKRAALNELQDEVKVLDGVRITFSTTGVKAQITSEILDVVNERLAFYLKSLNTPCSIIFDELFEEKVFNINGKEISYDRLSDGEKGRVCFSMLFTFRDIRRLQSNVTVNISVFDELFDSSIDSKAIGEIMNLLSIMSSQNQEAYYIITHRPENVNLAEGNIINLLKENGVTRIV